jgi:negative regulator of sigma E activity
MSEQAFDPRQRALEERSRELFQESVGNLDMRMRSRLTQARYAALKAAERSPRAWFLRMPVLTSAAGVTAAAVLGVALWFGGPAVHMHGGATADTASPYEDLELVASADSADSADNNVEMLQNDIDFYAWADNAEGGEPSA